MLFADATISTVADLAAYESEVQEVASLAGLDLETKLQRAQTEVGVELLATAVPGVAGDLFGSTIRLEQVAVTDALRLWHTFHTLSIVYRDAYNRKLNDKYLLKWNEYRALAKWATNLYFNLGVGLVYRPISAPGTPQLSSIPLSGSTMEESIYFARVTWCDGAGVESAPSPSVSWTVPAGEVLVVSTAGLTPPADATGWFPYVGLAAGEERRQASSAVPLGTAWTMPATGLSAGTPAGPGQSPDVFRQVSRTLQRG